MVQALYQWQLTGQETCEIEAQFLEEKDETRIDVAYFCTLLSQITQRVDELDAHIKPYLDRTIQELDLVERAILRMGAYELVHCLDVPYRVVINEGVDLAKRFGADQSYRYINGVLDRLAKKIRSAEVSA